MTDFTSTGIRIGPESPAAVRHRTNSHLSGKKPYDIPENKRARPPATYRGLST